MKPKTGAFTFLLGLAGLGLTTAVVVAASQAAPQQTSAVRPSKSATTPATQQAAKQPRARVSAPPLPNVGFAPVRPMDVVRATYDFAAQHPEILKYVPCYCGCGSQGHKANESCFVARRDAKGNVLEWDEHGFGCAICVDVARESMQLYSSGADVASIRAAIERRWAPGNAAGRTPTPAPPAKK
jgi:Protein of unknown function with PCYCGC motif